MIKCALNLTPPFEQLEVGNQKQIAWIAKAEQMKLGKLPFDKAEIWTEFDGYVRTRAGFVDAEHNLVHAAFICLFCKSHIDHDETYKNGLGEEIILQKFYAQDANGIECQQCHHTYRIDENKNIWVIIKEEEES